jgi:hypothetical protein
VTRFGEALLQPRADHAGGARDGDVHYKLFYAPAAKSRL